MPLHPIQRGELTDRLRRFFGIVGPYVGQVESTTSPVVLAQDISQAPFRTTGIRSFARLGLSAVAAQEGTITTVPGSLVRPYVIDWALFSNSGAAGNFVFWGTASAAFPSVFGAGTYQTGEVLGTSNPTTFNTPFDIVGGNAAPSANINIFGSVMVPAGGNVLVPLGMGLQPGQQFRVKGSVNSPILVSIALRHFDS